MTPASPSHPRALAALVLATALAAGCGDPDPARPTASAASARPAPNVLYVVWDAQRAANLSLYGYERPTTPFLEEFAEQCAVFERAHSQAPNTLPSMVTTFTSTYPQNHNANWATDGNRLVSTTPTSGAFTPLTWICRDAGLWTEAIVGNPWLTPDCGLASGFEHYEVLDGYENSDELTDRLERAIGELSDHPWFLYAHYIDPHAPFLPPEPHRGDFTTAPYEGDVSPWDVGLMREGKKPWGDEEVRFLTEWYDAEIRYMDEQLARVVAALETAGVLDDTLIVLTADHGEELGEHGSWEHGNLFEECIHIPMVVRFPGGAHAGRYDMLVETVDIYPTVAEVLGQPVPAHVQGTSLLAQIRGEWRREVSFAHYPAGRVQSFLFDDGKKLLVPKGPAEDIAGRQPLLYDLDTDPAEREGLDADEVDDFAHRLRESQRWLREAEQDAPSLTEVERTGENLEALRQLGYLGGDAMSEAEDG